MESSIHPAAPKHLPFFITAPGEYDVLMIVMAVVLIVSVMAVGLLYLRVHHLPDHIASRSQKVQYEFVAVLGLIAMFTHMNIFWIAALLLALLDLPDFGSPLRRIAGSLEKIAADRAPSPTSQGATIVQESDSRPGHLVEHKEEGTASKQHPHPVSDPTTIARVLH